MPVKRVIVNGSIAKKLVNRGHIIVDIAPSKENRMDSVFVFFVDSFFNLDTDDIMQNKTDDNKILQNRLEKLGKTQQQYKYDIFNEYLSSMS